MSDETAPAVTIDALPPTAKSRLICTCGWVASGRSPEASGAGYRDHTAFAHGLAWATETIEERAKAIA